MRLDRSHLEELINRLDLIELSLYVLKSKARKDKQHFIETLDFNELL